MAANVALNLVGQLAPALAAVLAMPFLVSGLGAERLGVLSLAWVAVGAFTLLDFGLGRSLTLEVSRKLALGRGEDVPAVVQGTLIVLAVVGVGGAATLAVARVRLLAALGVPAALAPEVEYAILGVCLAAPFMTVSAGMRGVLEAYGRFDLSNLVRVPLGVLTYLGPALALPFSRSVAVSVGVLVTVRVLGAAAFLVCVRALAGGGSGWHVEWHHLRAVVSSGWWMNVANLAGVALTYVDRLILGAMLSLAAVAFYATPQELVGKLTVVPVALSAVLFPALSSAQARQSTDLVGLFSRGLTYTFVLLLPVVMVAAALAPEWLGAWLGGEFARESARPAQWLLLSVLLQSLAITPLNLLQAIGHAPVTAWLQLLQLPLFVCAMWWAVSVAGITGAAGVWAARMLLDLTLLLAMARRYAPTVSGAIRSWVIVVPLTAVWFVAVTRLEALAARGGLLAVGLLAFAVYAPRLVGGNDLTQLRALLTRRFRPQGAR